MNLAKRNKIIALITIAVMVVAVATTCILCIPNRYNKVDDANMTNTAAVDYGIKEVTYNENNSAVAYVQTYKKNVITADNGDARILFPTHIYLDKTESLSQAGYYIAFDAWALPNDNKGASFVLFDSVFGLYDTSKSAYEKAKNKSNATTMMDNFNEYGNESWTLVKTVNAGDKSEGSGFIKTQKHDGSENYGAEVAGRNFNTTIKAKLSGTPNVTTVDGKALRYDFPTDSGITIAKMRWGKNGESGDVQTFPQSFTETGSSAMTGLDFTASYGSTVTSLGWDITIYDKKALYDTIQDFKAKIAKDEASFLKDIDVIDPDTGKSYAYGRALKFVEDIEDNVLKEREVLQSTINDAVDEINSYNTYLLTDVTKVESNKIYDAKSVDVASIFARCKSGFFATKISRDGTPTTDIKNAGTYVIEIAPLANISTGEIQKLAWYNPLASGGFDGNDYKECAKYVIDLREFKDVQLVNKIKNLQYKVSDHEIVLGAISDYGTFAGDISGIDVQLSLKQDEFKEGVDKVYLGDIGNHTVYYKLNESNHISFTGAFEVHISKADIVLHTKAGARYYGQAIPTSEEIVDMLIDFDNTSIFDATDSVAKKDYLIGNAEKGIDGILSMLQIVDSGIPIEIVDGKYPVAKKYDIQITRNSILNDRVNTVTFYEKCNDQIYTIQPRPVKITWEVRNLWYDGEGGKKPEAKLVTSNPDPEGNFGVIPGTNTDIIVNVVGDGIDFYGNTAELVGPENNKDAVYAGNYQAIAVCTNTNYSVDNSNAIQPFTIARRKINVEVQDRARTYAQAKTAQGVWNDYLLYFADNQDIEGRAIYNVKTDASVTDGKGALIDPATDVFTISLKDAEYTEGSESERYFKVGTYTLEPKLAIGSGSKARNYELVATANQNGTFTVRPAEITFTAQYIQSQIFKGKPLDLVLDKADSRIGFKGWESQNRNEVKIYFAESEQDIKDGNVRDTYLQKTDVGTYDVWCKITAPNHNDLIKHLTAVIEKTTLYIDVEGQNSNFVYGNGVPSSDELVSTLGINYYWSTDSTLNEQLKIENMENKIEFHLLDGTGGSGYFNPGDRIEVGKYTVSHGFINGEKSTNYDIRYVTFGNGNDEHKNTYAFEVSKKDLRVDWTQDGAGWNGLDYTFDGNTPTVKVKPVESDVAFDDKIELSVNVKEGVSLSPNVGTYALYTTFSNEEMDNAKNYNIANGETSFTIVPLQININVKTVEREFGTAQKNPPLGKKIALADLTNPGALWSYADGSPKFFQDDHRSFCLVSDAITADGSYQDVNEAGYPITVQAREGASTSVVNNYNVVVANTTEAVFKITPANIHYMIRQFNIDADKEDTWVTRDQVRGGIYIDDTLSGILRDDFTVKMTDLKKDDNTPSKDWIPESQDATDKVSVLGRYYMSIRIEHKNFDTFDAEIEVNVRSKWISVTLSGVAEAEYGEQTDASDVLYDKLKEHMKIDGMPNPAGGEDSYLKGEAAWTALKGMIDLFVGSGDTTNALTKNTAVGKYSIFFDQTKYEGSVVEADRKYFRFLSNGNSYTSNVNAYVVVPKTLGVNWQNMDEVYGEHSENSESHKYKDHLIVAADDEGKDFRLEEKYEKYNETTGKWELLDGVHARDVGKYRITVLSVNNSNYKVPANLSAEFEISKREVTIELSNRNNIVYGMPRATKDTISEHLNETSQSADLYKVVGEKDFVDDVSNIFRYKLATTLAPNCNYLPVAAYSFDVEMVDSAIANNYIVTVSKQGEFEVTNATISYDRARFEPKIFTGNGIKVQPAGAYYTLKGDVDSAILEFKIDGSAEDFKQDLYITEVGSYDILIRIKADNHDVYTTQTTVAFVINPVHVEISMTQATKTYGDTLEEILAAEGVNNFHEWLVKKCDITFDVYALVDGRREPVENFNMDRLKNDFLFKVIQNDQGNGTPIEVGKNRVGTYTVYHEVEDGDYPNKLKNYTVNYFKAADKNQACNYDAYRIDKRDVEVQWFSNGVEDGVKEFEYNGGLPIDLVAKVQEVGKSGLTSLPINSDFLGADGDREKADKVYNVGNYRATVISGGSFDMDSFLENYRMSNTSFEYTIYAKKVTVTVYDQSSILYGSEEAKVGVNINKPGAYEVSGEDINVIGQYIKLSVEGVAAKDYYNVGAHKIKVDCTSANYEVEANEATFTVDPANIDLSGSHRQDLYYNGKDFVVDAKQMLMDDSRNVVFGDMTWEDATVLYKQEDGTFSEVKPIIKGVNTDGVTFECKIVLEYHNEKLFNVTYTMRKAEIIVVLQNGGAYSVYGDDLLTSDELFDKTDAKLSAESTITDINLKDLIELRVDASGRATAGKYNVEYSFVNQEDAQLYNVTIQNALAYEVKQKELIFEWDYKEPFVYDQNTHTVNAVIVGGLLSGDEVHVVCSGNTGDQAREYVATIESVDNGNYKCGNSSELKWKIAPKGVTVEWVAGDFTYDGNEHLVAVPSVSEGLIGYDTTEIQVKGAKVNAGEHTATAISTNSNYVVTNSEFIFVIKQASLNIVWNNDKLTYNGKAQAPSAQIDRTGLIGNDDCKVEVEGAQVDAGKYTASAKLSNGNYKIAQNATCDFTIAQKTITFAWADEKLVYTGDPQAPKAVANGLIEGDTVEFEIEGMQVNAGKGYVAKVVGVKDNDNYVVDESAMQLTKTFDIDKGTNEFIKVDELPSVSDKLPWLEGDKPEAKWGEVIIKYYSDKDCTKEVVDIANAGEGKYWVKISVAGSENYDGIDQVFEIEIQGGFNVVPVVLGAVATVALLAGALAVVLITNKKNKQKGGAV